MTKREQPNNKQGMMEKRDQFSNVETLKDLEVEVETHTNYQLDKSFIKEKIAISSPSSYPSFVDRFDRVVVHFITLSNWPRRLVLFFFFNFHLISLTQIFVGSQLVIKI